MEQAVLACWLLACTLGVAHGKAMLWDASWSVATAPFPSLGTLADVAIERALLYAPNSSWPFLPAAFQLPSQPATLTLSDSTISTLCSTVAAYSTFLNASVPGGSEARLTIGSYEARLQALTLRITNLTLHCLGSTGFQAAEAFANSSATFQAAISAVSSLGVSGHVTLDGPASILIRDGWPAAGYPMGPGTSLSIMSTDRSGVLDLDMSANLINFVSGPVSLSGVTLINLCTVAFQFQGLTVLTTYVAKAFSLPARAWGSGIKNILYNDTTLVVPRQEMDSLAYWTAMYPSPFPKINAYGAVFTKTYPNNPPYGFMPTEDTLNLTFGTDTISATYIVMQASDSMDLLESSHMLVEPPTFCPGSSGTKERVPTALLNDNSLNPLFQITAANPVNVTLPAALRFIAAGAAKGSASYPPMVVQFVNASLAAWPPAGVETPISSDMLWVGPSVPRTVSANGSTTAVALDLQQLTGAIRLVGNATALYMQRLTLVNLSTTSVQGSLLRPGVTLSALPLWIFQFDRTAARVMLESMTMVLPRSSFAPLYALAKVGGLPALADARQANPRWASLQSASLDDITAFTVSSFDTSAIHLSAYSGLGVTAMDLLLTVDIAFVDDQPSANDPAADSSSSGSSSSSTAIIVGVVVGVGGALLVAAVLVAVWWTRKRKLQKSASTSPPSSPGGAEAMLPKAVDLPAKAGDQSNDTLTTSGIVVSAMPGDHPSSGSQIQEDSRNGSKIWDPMKEVQQLVGQVQGNEGEKLQLLEPIGKGGFGTVYRGRWRNLDVAVKTVLFTNKEGDEDSPERHAITEAAVASSVVHPHVVSTYHYDIRPVLAVAPEGAMQIQIHEGGQHTDWKLYLVQELCHASLADALVSSFLHDKNSRQPTLSILLSILNDVASGMAYIHSKKIIHGDLKPENVLLKHSPDNSIGIISKITDFGLSMPMDPTKSHISGFLTGTRFYSAPEVALTGKATKTSDVYSYGILMVEMYRGVPPWVKTANGFRQNKNFMRLPTTTPLPFLRLAQRCLDKNPKQRPEFRDIDVIIKEMVACLNDGWIGLERTAAAVPSPADLNEAAAEEPGTSAATGTSAAPEAPAAPLTPQAMGGVQPGSAQSPVTQEVLVSWRGSRRTKMRDREDNEQEAGEEQAEVHPMLTVQPDGPNFC